MWNTSTSWHSTASQKSSHEPSRCPDPRRIDRPDTAGTGVSESSRHIFGLPSRGPRGGCCARLERNRLKSGRGCADRARARMRCERRWDAVGCPRAASSVSESESDNRRRSEHCVRPPPKCHRDLTVLWGSLRAPANAMTPFYRGVSDLGCGRGHDRRRGQISWSLTPRSPHWRGDDRGRGERSATHADRVLRTRSGHRTSTCSGRQRS